MKNDNMILRQMSLNTDILPEHLSAAILAGHTPPVEEIVLALVVGGTDAHAVTHCDPQATWIDKRAARLALAGVFLAAMVVMGGAKENV